MFWPEILVDLFVTEGRYIHRRCKSLSLTNCGHISLWHKVEFYEQNRYRSGSISNALRRVALNGNSISFGLPTPTHLAKNRSQILFRWGPMKHLLKIRKQIKQLSICRTFVFSTVIILILNKNFMLWRKTPKACIQSDSVSALYVGM